MWGKNCPLWFIWIFRCSRKHLSRLPGPFPAIQWTAYAATISVCSPQPASLDLLRPQSDFSCWQSSVPGGPQTQRAHSELQQDYSPTQFNISWNSKSSKSGLVLQQIRKSTARSIPWLTKTTKPSPTLQWSLQHPNSSISGVSKFGVSGFGLQSNQSSYPHNFSGSTEADGVTSGT